MKPLLIVLLLATMAWGGESIVWESDFITPTCVIDCKVWKNNECEKWQLREKDCPQIEILRDTKKEKGHCPHCGALGIKYMTFNLRDDECKQQQLPTRKERTGWITNCRQSDNGYSAICDEQEIDVCGFNLYRCPNGHVFWEKGE